MNEHVDGAENLDIIMLMYNLIEFYSIFRHFRKFMTV